MPQLIHFNPSTRTIAVLENEQVSFYNAGSELLKQVFLKDISFEDEAVKYFEVVRDSDVIELCCKEDGVVYYCQFDGEGECVSKKLLSRNTNEILLGLDEQDHVKLLFNDDDANYDANCKAFKNDQEIAVFDLLELSVSKARKGLRYEYLECFVGTGKPNMIAFIAAHATYGTEGVKIFAIESGAEPKPVYEMESMYFDEGAIHNLAFNQKADKFTLLLYQRDQADRDYLSVLEYSLDNDEKPIKKYTTEFGHWQFNPIHTQYLTGSLLCIVRSADIILFDMNTGVAKEVLKRDLNSVFCVSSNILIYQLSGLFVVAEY